ncbi:MAG: hypothetical protein H8D22_10635 [Candidatus Cloacimonetes bacterium]|nr:hypothetical protein [Candidatus Cloacimonadota bacterium]
MKLEFNCPECGEKIITFFSEIGDTAKCQHCNKVIIVPEDAIEVKKEYPITTLEFRCLNCDNNIIIENSKIGEKIECPFCHKTMVIPKDAEDIYEKYTKEEYRKKKYPGLRTLSGFFVFIAVLMGIQLIIGIIYGASLLSYHDQTTGTIIIFSSIIIGFIGIIVFAAFAELIKLFIDIESNTKNQTLLIEKLLKK